MHIPSFGGLVVIPLLKAGKLKCISNYFLSLQIFEPNRNRSCIELVVTNQLKIILDSGTQASLDSYCHHQTITDIFLNILSNFIPNETKRIVSPDRPWLTKPLKTMYKKKDRFFKIFKKHGYRLDDKVRLDTSQIDC